MTRKSFLLGFLLVIALSLTPLTPLSRLLTYLPGSSIFSRAVASASFSSSPSPSSMADATDAVPVPPAGVFSAAFVTVPNMEVAEKLASGLVTSKLAACVNIIPGLTSVYEWEGKVEKDSELLLMIKTRTDRVDELSAWVKGNHPYDVCEVISTKIDNGNPPYLKWLGEVVPPRL